LTISGGAAVADDCARIVGCRGGTDAALYADKEAGQNRVFGPSGLAMQAA
jgi:hypothetical protein